MWMLVIIAAKISDIPLLYLFILLGAGGIGWALGFVASMWASRRCMPAHPVGAFLELRTAAEPHARKLAEAVYMLRKDVLQKPHLFGIDSLPEHQLSASVLACLRSNDEVISRSALWMCCVLAVKSRRRYDRHWRFFWGWVGGSHGVFADQGCKFSLHRVVVHGREIMDEIVRLCVVFSNQETAELAADTWIVLTLSADRGSDLSALAATLKVAW